MKRILLFISMFLMVFSLQAEERDTLDFSKLKVTAVNDGEDPGITFSQGAISITARKYKGKKTPSVYNGTQLYLHYGNSMDVKTADGRIIRIDCSIPEDCLTFYEDLYNGSEEFSWDWNHFITYWQMTTGSSDVFLTLGYQGPSQIIETGDGDLRIKYIVVTTKDRTATALSLPHAKRQQREDYQLTDGIIIRNGKKSLIP